MASKADNTDFAIERVDRFITILKNMLVKTRQFKGGVLLRIMVTVKGKG